MYLVEGPNATAAAAAGGGSGEENSRSGSAGVCASVAPVLFREEKWKGPKMGGRTEGGGKWNEEGGGRREKKRLLRDDA